ncbi:DUF4910 domain-containing protein [Pontibacter qinzhouensis]|uniref:DUF4910 domain-containing protein n=1 Tax=Pontibacter qinzhouensis TaxID=2603253 RepID=A0A5C8IHI9_9BACT|nr:DUF4910 domain-containing protein [Pontibacter qinzhouensis]TXK21068.1 DUF4910 domain-containing protein [Pontibacter qinzhouensis]
MKPTLPLPEIEEATSAIVGEEMHALVAKLFPVCRSITGNGVRQTLQILQDYIPLVVHEVPSGTPVFDWVVPKEWNIQDAYLLNEAGEKVVDFAANNLHVLNYSTPINKQLPLQELKKHLFSLPEQPDLIPYKTSYYKPNWGFCLPDRQLQTLEEGLYTAVIDATLEDGSLTYGELYLPGETEDEVLVSSHVCHPSICNDNLSGIAVATFLARELAGRKNRYSYRFIFIPATIGAITWLSQNENRLANIRHGLVLTLLGDEASFTYKRTREGNFEIDEVVEHVLQACGKGYQLIDFFPYGYDERQFCSPGFNLPVGCLMRSQHGEFPEYHTSADNLEFVKAGSLAESVALLLEVTQVLEQNRKYRNTNPKCEPKLGKRGLYDSIAGSGDWKSREMAMFWLLNLSDGQHSLLAIAKRSGIAFSTIAEVAAVLQQHALLEPVT